MVKCCYATVTMYSIYIIEITKVCPKYHMDRIFRRYPPRVRPALKSFLLVSASLEIMEVHQYSFQRKHIHRFSQIVKILKNTDYNWHRENIIYF